MINYYSTTEIPLLSLQARDWHFIASQMKANELFEDLSFALKTKFQVPTPPTGQVEVSVENQYAGQILSLYNTVQNGYGKEVGKSTRNRFKTALLALNIVEITDALAELDANDIAAENQITETGRKFLRGKLG